MKEIRKNIVIGYCIAIILAAVYVPWKVEIRTEEFSTVLSQGYSLFFLPPSESATIDYGKVLLEFVAISAIAGLFYAISDKLVGK